MRQKLLLIFLIVFIGVNIVKAQPSAQVNLLWAKGTEINDPEAVECFKIDHANNLYTVGGFRGTQDFDPGPGLSNLTSAGLIDISIRKLDSVGNFVWAKRLGGTSWDSGIALDIDSANNIVVTGYFNSTTDFDPGAGVYTLSPLGGYSAFVLKLDSAGNFIWVKQLEGTADVLTKSITIDRQENIVLTGYFGGSADFDPSSSTYTLSASASSSDIFVCKLDAAGNFIWAKGMGAGGNDHSFSVCTDKYNNVYTTGRFVLTVDFDPGVSVYNLVSSPSGYDEIFVSKLDASGNFVWAKSMGGGNQDASYSITLDTAGNVYTTGYFNGIADFDPGPATYNLTSAGGDDVFVSKLDSAGNFVWAKSFGSNDLDRGASISIDPFGNVYSTGIYLATADFDPGPGVYNFTPVLSGTNVDSYISILNSAGDFVWAGTIGGKGVDQTLTINAESESHLFVSGYSYDTLDVDPSPGTYMLSGVSGQEKGFILKFCVLPVPIISETGALNFCSGDSVTLVSNPADTYLWSNGAITQSIQVFSSGTYSVETSNAEGCTAISTLITVIVDTIPNQPIISVSGGTLLSSSATGNQWYLNGTLISGATNQTYVFTTNGTYTVIVTNGPCASAASAPTVITTTGIDQANNPYLLSVYPNPNDGNFNVSFGVIEKGSYTIELTNSLGQLIFKDEVKDFTGKYVKQLSVVDYGKGVYTLVLTNEKHEVVKKIVVY